MKKTKTVHFLKSGSAIVLLILLLYGFRFFTVELEAHLFRIVFDLPTTTTLESLQQHGIFLEVILQIALTFLVVLVFKIGNHFQKTYAIFLKIILISPIVFEISSILKDRSCLKPWIDFQVLGWYLLLKSFWLQ